MPIRTLDTCCPMCGGRRGYDLGKRRESDRSGWLLQLVRCGTCDLVYLENPPTAFCDVKYDYYAGRYEQTKEELYNDLTDLRYAELLNRFTAFIQGDRILDVGCGQGQFVAAAVKAGWAAEGIDLSESAIQLCKKFGVPCEQVDVFDPKLGQYDVVTLFESIEHVPNPVQFLRRCAELVAPGGLLYVTTPNFASLDRRVAGVHWASIHSEHLLYFTPATIEELLSRAAPKFVMIDLATKNLSIGAYLDLVHRLVKRRSAEPDPATGAIRQWQQTDNQVRESLEANALLRWSKLRLNHVLNQSRLGNALTFLAQKPR